MELDDFLNCKDMKLAIATPFYNVQGYSPYVTSLAKSVLMLARYTEMEFDFWQISGDSYIDRARNSLCNGLLRSDFTHILFIDSDEGWDLPGFLNIVKSPHDIVGAGYPCKNIWDFYGVVLNNDAHGLPIIDKATGAISALCIPAGFMKISKKALLQLAPHVSTYTNPYNGDEKDYDFFSRIQPLGEDGSFNLRCETAGIPRWVEPRTIISHWGVSEHRGSYYEHLFGNINRAFPMGGAGCMENMMIGKIKGEKDARRDESGQSLQSIEEKGNEQREGGEDSAVADGIVPADGEEAENDQAQHA